MFAFLSRLSRSILLAALAAALLPGASAAQNKTPVIAVGKITVKGGNRIGGVEHGVIFQRQFDKDCLLSDQLSMQPVAASLGQKLDFEVELISCPAIEKPARIRCRTILNRIPRSDWVEARGPRLTVPVPLPDATGLHGVQLECSHPRSETFPTRLFLTYAPPRPMVDPPEPVWYEKACGWGEGLTAADTEQEVADQILNALFFHGQRQWRYALCKIQGKHCTLAGTTVSRDGLLCYCDDGICKLPWTELVRATGDRNFSDCYQFSAAFEYIVATMGVGGMVEEEVFGRYRLGFMTRPTIRSLDPAFGGNLMCGARGEACAFTFDNHDVRRRGNRIYDATFGGIYDDPDDLIFQNVLGGDANTRFFATISACKGEDGYGSFRTYREPVEANASCERVSGAKLGQALVRHPALSTDSHPETGVLAVHVEVIVEKQGIYSIEGGIYCDDGTAVTLRPRRGHVNLRSTAEVSGPPGTYQRRLTFSGSDLSRSRCASYELRAYLTAGTAAVDELKMTIPLPPELLESLDDKAASLGPPAMLELAWVHPGPALRATLPVTVRAPGLFAVEARLAHGENTLSYGGYRRDLDWETESLVVDFPLGAGPIPMDGDEISIALHRLDSVGALEPVDGLLIQNVKLPPP